MEIQKNIFLIHLTRDYLRINGFYEHFQPREIFYWMKKTLNISVFLCRDYCILNPGSVFECDFLSYVLAENTDYLSEGLIRFPIKESSIGNFVERRESYYSYVKKEQNLNITKAKKSLLLQNASWLLQKKVNTGKSISTKSLEAPDVNAYWRSLLIKTDTSTLESLRSVPKRLIETGMAVTWSAINKNLNYSIDFVLGQSLILNLFLEAYGENFDFSLLNDIPAIRVDLGFGSYNLYYSYNALNFLMAKVGIWEYISMMNDYQMIKLKTSKEYLNFIEVYIGFTQKFSNLSDFKKSVTLFIDVNLNVNPWILYKDKLSYSAVLESLDFLSSHLQNIQLLNYSVKPSNRSQAMIKDVQPKVAIFVPMSEEREILIDALSCNFQLLKHSVWQGELNGVSIHIYSPGKIGRVSAAVETMAYLNQFTPELIIVAGIAGGFKNIVNKGAVVIPEEIVDLAYRKQIESKSLYRPKIYSISSSILSYFKSNIFNEQDWSSTVILQDKFDWDKGLKPYILCEKARLVSTDEILMDQDYVDKLTNEYPDTVGVEMESGGVFAAAKQFDIDVLTIRGISDSSDAEKEDDKWRKLAMRGVSLLIKNIDYKTLLSFRRTSN